MNCIENLELTPATLPGSKSNARRCFLHKHKACYGYGLGDKQFRKMVKNEYPSLRDAVYLDYSASPPIPTATISLLATTTSSTLFSNPHSRSQSSSHTTSQINRVRSQVMSEIFGLKAPESQEKWDLVFTSGATGGLKLVAEAFDWKRTGSSYRYLKEAHTSVLGIRGCALSQGANVSAMDLQEVEVWLRPEKAEAGESELFSYAAQCNATGKRLGVGLGRQLKRRHPGYKVLLDAAAYLSTTPLELDSIPIEEAPDFVVCSFYKIFGYPTGLGCLLVKLSAYPSISSRSYFGGGTIEGLSSSSPFWSFPYNSSSTTSQTFIHPALEDGTVNFLGIIALGLAFKTFHRIYRSLLAISKHAICLADFARVQLDAIVHPNGVQAVKRHAAFRSSDGTSINLELSDGPVISFTLYTADSRPIGHVTVDRLARDRGLQLRSGGLCNVGLVESALGYDDEEILELYKNGRRCGGDDEFAPQQADESEDRPLGIVRVSFGAASTIDDVLAFVAFVRETCTCTSEKQMRVEQEKVEVKERVVKPKVSLKGKFASLLDQRYDRR